MIDLIHMARSRGLVIAVGSLLGVGVAVIAFAGRRPAPASASPPPPAPTRAAAVPPPRAPESNFIAALRRHEANGDWVEFCVLAFNEASTISAPDRPGALELLNRHQANGGFPALFCIARHHWFAGDKDEACRWFLRASVVGSIDAQRCTDPTSRQAVHAVRAHFAPLAEHLKGVDRAKQTRWVREALDFEQTIADREPARWIAAHGIGAFGASAGNAPDPFVGADQWPGVRERARASIAGSLPEHAAPR